ncbi:MAG: hypothetical protein ACOCSF_03985 [Halanaeroarchaeum sp.]
MSAQIGLLVVGELGRDQGAFAFAVANTRAGMKTPAVYDLQTEKFAYPEGDRFTIGTNGDVTVPIGDPWGNRGGAGNVATLLEDVAEEHVRVTLRGVEDAGVARVVPMAETATIYVREQAVGERGRAVEAGETIVLGRGKSDLWEGYRVQVFA